MVEASLEYKALEAFRSALGEVTKAADALGFEVRLQFDGLPETP
jgi:hypothetical protein